MFVFFVLFNEVVYCFEVVVFVVCCFDVYVVGFFEVYVCGCWVLGEEFGEVVEFEFVGEG